MCADPNSAACWMSSTLLFLARAKLDNLLIDALLHKDRTREHFNHFYLFQSLVLV